MTSKIELEDYSLDLIITEEPPVATTTAPVAKKGRGRKPKTSKPEVLKLSYPMINGDIDGSFVHFLRESIANGTLTADIAKQIAECNAEDIEVNEDETLKIRTSDRGDVKIPKAFPANRQQQLVMALNSDYRDAVMAVDLAERLDIFNRTAYNGKLKGEVKAHKVKVEKRGKPSKDLKPSRFVVDIQAVEDNFNEKKKETSKKDQKTEKGKIRIAAMLAAVPLEMAHPSKQKDNGDLDVFADQAFDPLFSSVGRSKTFTDNFLGEELLGSSLGRSKTPSALIAKKHKSSKYASPKKQEALTLDMLNEVTKDKIENEAEVAGNFKALFRAVIISNGLQIHKRADRIFASNLAQARLLLKLANPYNPNEPIATALGNENVDTGLTIEQEIKNQMSNFASAYKSAAEGSTVANQPNLTISTLDIPVHDLLDLTAIGADAESKLKKKTFTAHKAKSSTLKAPAKDAAKEKTKTGDQTTFFTKKIQLEGKTRPKTDKRLVVSLPSSESIRYSKQIQTTHSYKTPTRKLNSFEVAELSGDTSPDFTKLLKQSKHLVAANLTAEKSKEVNAFKKTDVEKLANATVSASQGFMPGVSKEDEMELAHQIVFLDHKIIQARRDGNKPFEATSKLALKIALQNEKPIDLDPSDYQNIERALTPVLKIGVTVDSLLELTDVKFSSEVYQNKKLLLTAISENIQSAGRELGALKMEAPRYDLLSRRKAWPEPAGQYDIARRGAPIEDADLSVASGSMTDGDGSRLQPGAPRTGSVSASGIPIAASGNGLQPPAANTQSQIPVGGGSATAASQDQVAMGQSTRSGSSFDGSQPQPQRADARTAAAPQGPVAMGQRAASGLSVADSQPQPPVGYAGATAAPQGPVAMGQSATSVLQDGVKAVRANTPGGARSLVAPRQTKSAAIAPLGASPSSPPDRGAPNAGGAERPVVGEKSGQVVAASRQTKIVGTMTL